MKTTLRIFLCLAIAAGGSARLIAQDAEAPSTVTNAGSGAAVESAEDAAQSSATSPGPGERWSSYRMGPIVTIGRTAELGTNQTAEAVVAVMGSARSAGRVQDAVVAVIGNAEVSGEVGETVVAVLGDATVNAEVGDAVVAVLGNVTLGSNAVVRGDVVAVGGRVIVTDGAEIHGQVQEVDFQIPGLPRFEVLSEWVRQCLLKLRPLAPQVPWVWGVAGVFFLIYLLVAVAFPRPVTVCVNELNKGPATTFFVGLLTKILIPVIILVLAATGIGLVVVPFVIAAAFFAGVIGKVALLEYLGGAIGRGFGLDGTRQRLLAFLIGTVLMVVLYIIPVIGFLAYTIFGMWSLGAAVTAAFAGMSRERPRTPPPSGGTPGPAAPQPPVQYAPAMPSPYSGAQGASNPAPAVSGEPPVHAVVPAALMLPRAGFWERMGAGFLDISLLGVVTALVGPFVLIIGLAYFAGMWAWKGTTLGGLVLKHQVVRQDGEPITFLVALVRGLAAFFSAFFLFLGFFWIGWNPEKQGWHDMIAGTCVVRLPRAVPLVCL